MYGPPPAMVSIELTDLEHSMHVLGQTYRWDPDTIRRLPVIRRQKLVAVAEYLAEQRRGEKGAPK